MYAVEAIRSTFANVNNVESRLGVKSTMPLKSLWQEHSRVQELVYGPESDTHTLEQHSDDITVSH